MNGGRRDEDLNERHPAARAARGTGCERCLREGQAAMNLARLIPSPIATEGDARRWRHLDLCDVERLNLRDVWAERCLVESELAWRLIHRRPKIVHIES